MPTSSRYCRSSLSSSLREAKTVRASKDKGSTKANTQLLLLAPARVTTFKFDPLLLLLSRLKNCTCDVPNEAPLPLGAAAAAVPSARAGVAKIELNMSRLPMKQPLEGLNIFFNFFLLDSQLLLLTVEIFSIIPLLPFFFPPFIFSFFLQKQDLKKKKKRLLFNYPFRAK